MAFEPFGAKQPAEAEVSGEPEGEDGDV